MSRENNEKAGQSGRRLMRFFSIAQPAAQQRLYGRLTGKRKKIARVTGFKPREALPPTRQRLLKKNKGN